MAATVASMPKPLPVDPCYTPEVSITKLSATASVNQILEILERDGGVILEDFVSTTELDKIQKELHENADQAEKIQENGAISIVPKETTLVSGLVGKSKTIRDIILSPLLTSLRKDILTESYTVGREGSPEQHSIDPLLSLTVSFNIGTGAPRQLLHRDDNIHHIDHSRPFVLKKASQFACLIAGCDTTRENGATMFIPGSHKWDDIRRPKIDEICFAEMEKGSALIFLGSAYHGGGHNSIPDFKRVVHGLFFIRGYLRQEENQFLAVPHSKVLGMDEELLTLLGYKKPTTVLGIVENQDPAADLKGVLDRVSM